MKMDAGIPDLPWPNGHAAGHGKERGKGQGGNPSVDKTKIASDGEFIVLRGDDGLYYFEKPDDQTGVRFEDLPRLAILIRDTHLGETDRRVYGERER